MNPTATESTVKWTHHRPTRGSVGIEFLKVIRWRSHRTHKVSTGNTTRQEVYGTWYLILQSWHHFMLLPEGIYNWTDGGNNLEYVLNQHMVMDLLIDPVDSNVVYAGGECRFNQCRIYRTINGGSNWSRLNNGLPPVTYRKNYSCTNPLNHNSVLGIGCISILLSGSTDPTIKGSLDIYQRTHGNCFHQGWYAKGLCFKNDDSTKILFGGVDVFRSDFVRRLPLSAFRIISLCTRMFTIS